LWIFLRKTLLPRFQLAENCRIYYRFIEGKPERTHLVFLHEGLGCDAMWGGFPDRLCTACQCPGLVYDRLGYGRSSGLQHPRTIHYMHEYALFELPRLLGAVLPDAPFALIGHSDGGSISLIFGAERPVNLKGIITEAAHVFVEPETIAGIRQARIAWEEGKLTGLSKYHGDKSASVFTAWSDTWLSFWFRWWNIEHLLPGILAPVLVIQGRDDQYGSESQVKAIVSKTGGPARAELIEGCRHAPHAEAEATVIAVMKEFIEEIRVSGK
jgi:pimeloyl-ACP methyl ester carboxylesterase